MIKCKIIYKNKIKNTTVIRLKNFKDLKSYTDFILSDYDYYLNTIVDNEPCIYSVYSYSFDKKIYVLAFYDRRF